MKLKLASGVKWKHVVFAVILLIVFVLTVGTHIAAEGFAYESTESESTLGDVPLTLTVGGISLYKGNKLSSEELAGPAEEVTVDINYLSMYLNDYSDDITLQCKIFGLNSEEVIASLEELYNASSDEFETTNVGYLRDEEGNLLTFDSAQLGLYMYLQNYVDEHPESVNTSRVQYTGNAAYVESLIIYLTKNIFTNVDTNLALSIGAAESGYYTVSYMLRSGNVYGGMGSNGLIKYRTIEYGVYKYVKYLSVNYISKGYTDLYSIGRIYCPSYDSNGNRVASSHWISLVTRANSYYSDYNFEISASDVLASK